MIRWFLPVLTLFFAAPAFCKSAETPALDDLLSRLAQSPSEREAEQTIEEVWALFFDSGSPTVDLLLQRGITAEKAGLLDLASDFYGDVIEFAPDFAEGYNRRAGLEFARGDYNAALEDLNQVLSLQPRHFGALAGLGMVLERMGAKAAAFQAYSDALAINPFEKTAKAGAARLSSAVKGRSL